MAWSDDLSFVLADRHSFLNKEQSTLSFTGTAGKERVIHLSEATHLVEEMEAVRRAVQSQFLKIEERAHPYTSRIAFPDISPRYVSVQSTSHAEEVLDGTALPFSSIAYFDASGDPVILISSRKGFAESVLSAFASHLDLVNMHYLMAHGSVGPSLRQPLPFGGLNSSETRLIIEKQILLAYRR